MLPYSKEEIRKAREMDLLTYLTYFEPRNLRHVSGSIYSTYEHDSLVINNGKWCWFSRGIGGKSALDFLIKVRDIPFLEAVERILGTGPGPMPTIIPPSDLPKEFIMPEVNSDTSRVREYLIGRGIDPEIVNWCIKRGYIFETVKFSNALFVGYDRDRNPKYGAVRATCGDYKGDVKGSDKRFSFRIVRADHPKNVHVFEAVPDLLSYATIVKNEGHNWHSKSYLSLAGIGNGKSIPKALEQFLKDYPDITDIYLHLDNDEPGRIAAKNIKELLQDRYHVHDQPPPSGKDFNDYLRTLKTTLRPPNPIRR